MNTSFPLMLAYWGVVIHAALRGWNPVASHHGLFGGHLNRTLCDRKSAIVTSGLTVSVFPGVRRRQDDIRRRWPAHPTTQDHGNRKRKLARQEPSIMLPRTPASPPPLRYVKTAQRRACLVQRRKARTPMTGVSFIYRLTSQMPLTICFLQNPRKLHFRKSDRLSCQHQRSDARKARTCSGSIGCLRSAETSSAVSTGMSGCAWALLPKLLRR